MESDSMKIGIASDHRGYLLKEKLIDYLCADHEVIDFGTTSEQAVDYPDYAFLLGQAVSSHQVDRGIAICGSGIGISIACNKVKGVRASKVDSIQDVQMTRKDNDANIICLSENTSLKWAKRYVDTFLHTPFSNEVRHQKRIQKIKDYEEGHYVR